MTMGTQPAGAPAPCADHRIQTAQRRREQMRRRIVEATTAVFSRRSGDAPVIEDVVREAGISRGAFYTYFKSLDEALLAASIEANERMIADILPLYDFLKEPWQRTSVGFRVFMVRGWQDPRWATFVSRMDAWPRHAQIAIHMSQDFLRGRALGQFRFDDVAMANDFIMGASAGCVQAMAKGVADPDVYMDGAVRMLMSGLGAEPALQERAVAFSRTHLSEWTHGGRSPWCAGRGRAEPDQAGQPA